MCSMSICLSVSASLALSGGVKLWCNSSKGSTPVELKHPPPFRIIIYTSNLQGLEPLAHSTVSKHFLNSQECHKSMKCVLVCVCVCVCVLCSVSPLVIPMYAYFGRIINWLILTIPLLRKKNARR